MISLTNFINLMENAGSVLSADFNTNILGGVPGMPLTHQIGFGAYHRRGTNVNFVDMDDLNNSTHLRLFLAFGGAAVTKNIINDAQSDLFSIVFGSATAYFTFTQASELYRDWLSGFEAAKELYDDYFIERGISRPVCAEKPIAEIPSAIYLQKQHNPQFQLSFIGNQRPRKVKRIRRRQGFSYVGNQSTFY